MATKSSVTAFANNKGGSGKTTTCANVGYSLSVMGMRVLMIDCDMQLNLTLSFFDEQQVLEFASGDRNLYHAVCAGEDLGGYVQPTKYDNLDLIPSSSLMSGIEYELFRRKKGNKEFILKDCLAGIRDSGEYDHILIDAPPTLGMWVMNILCASDYVVIPVEASPWGLFGVASLFDFLDDAKKHNNDLKTLGIVITKVDMRKNYFRQTLEALREAEGVKVFDTVIRIDSAVEWAQDNSKPIMAYKKSARSAGEYMALAKEMNKLCQ